MFHQWVSGISADSRGMVNLSGFGSHARHWQGVLLYLAQTLLSGHSKLDPSPLLRAGTLFLTSSQAPQPSQPTPPPREMGSAFFSPSSSSHNPPSCI